MIASAAHLLGQAASSMVMTAAQKHASNTRTASAARLQQPVGGNGVQDRVERRRARLIRQGDCGDRGRRNLAARLHPAARRSSCNPSLAPTVTTDQESIRERWCVRFIDSKTDWSRRQEAVIELFTTLLPSMCCCLCCHFPWEVFTCSNLA